jgi:hypothetical protein
MISTTQIWGLLKKALDRDSNTRIAVMTKTMYIENSPTNRFTASIHLTQVRIVFGMLIPLLMVPQIPIYLKSMLTSLVSPGKAFPAYPTA